MGRAIGSSIRLPHFFGQFCLHAWPRDVPSFGWRFATLAVPSLAALVVGALFFVKCRGRLRHQPPGVPLFLAVMIVTALVAGLASGVVFDEATRDLGRNY